MSDPPAPDRRATPDSPVDRRTNRWLGVSALSLLAASAGVFLSSAALVLVAVVGVAFGALSHSATPPTPRLELTRELDPPDPDPGETATVTVTVTNVGDDLVPDLRVVDGVPDRLAVVGGTPRHATALRPGKRARFRYEVTAVRGAHRFVPATVLARDWSGAAERELAVESETETTLTVTPPLPSGAALPLRALTSRYAGRVATGIGGPGTEFHAVREYRPGDPLSRIDWRRAARTGEYATLQFREERAATVVLVVDSREAAYRSPDGRVPSAVEHAAAAAGELYTSLVGAGDRVGLAAFGPDEFFLAPGGGDEHRARVRVALGSHAGFGSVPSEETFLSGVALLRLRRRLPADAQVVLCSPLADDGIVRIARRLEASGHLVTVVSPDPTGEGSHGGRLARLERSLRCSRLRGSGLRVVDWDPDRPLAVAVARAARRWSA